MIPRFNRSDKQSSPGLFRRFLQSFRRPVRVAYEVGYDATAFRLEDLHDRVVMLEVAVSALQGRGDMR